MSTVSPESIKYRNSILTCHRVHNAALNINRLLCWVNFAMARQCCPHALCSVLAVQQYSVGVLLYLQYEKPTRNNCWAFSTGFDCGCTTTWTVLPGTKFGTIQLICRESIDTLSIVRSAAATTIWFHEWRATVHTQIALKAPDGASASQLHAEVNRSSDCRLC